MANEKYLPAVGKRYTRIPKLILDYELPNQVKGSIIEVTAVLQADGIPSEIVGFNRTPLPFEFGPSDFSTLFPLVNQNTDEDGTAGYPQALLDAWAAAVKAGAIPLALVQVGVFSVCRDVQRKRDNPPPPVDPRAPL